MKSIPLLYFFLLFGFLNSCNQSSNLTRVIISGDYIFRFQNEHVHGSGRITSCLNPMIVLLRKLKKDLMKCLKTRLDGLLHISYSFSLGDGKKTIQHVLIDPERLVK